MSSTVGFPAVLKCSSQSARARSKRPIGTARSASMSPGRRLAAASIAAGLAYFGLRRVVDEQDDAEVGVLLQRGRQHGHADDALVLLIGGDEHGQRRCRALEGLAQLGAGRAAVVARPGVVAQAGDQVGQRRAGQQAHDHEVADRGEVERGPAGRAGDRAAGQRQDDEDEPADDRDHDRQLSDEHGALRRRRGEDGKRRSLVAAPLTPGSIAARLVRVPSDAPHEVNRSPGADRTAAEVQTRCAPSTW